MEMAFAVVCALLSIAVSWGVFSNKIETLREEISTIWADLKECVKKETCAQSHKYTDRDMAELKQDIREIKDMLQKLTSRNENKD